MEISCLLFANSVCGVRVAYPKDQPSLIAPECFGDDLPIPLARGAVATFVAADAALRIPATALGKLGLGPAKVAS
tara:strand:+ start:1585 stop:1809 length:225 start_codon:yes stop_codon:yes gene_type:complete